ncbi:MAG: hypothetical protein L7F78_26110, partial [Syntrophales bacterium LBB04]|nr:hypothetical protein [Syntrophales bacterium LBB04]
MILPQRLTARIPQSLKGSLPLYLVLTLSLLGYYLLSWPIEARDTDLWYHLSAGRHFFASGEVPHSTFFSFLLPVREYLDYYWLFQVLVYKIFCWGDYYGLIVLRAALYLAALLFVFLLL